MLGDAGWLERLLLNLLDNAIKFTAAGGRVAVAVTANERHVVLRVEDTGIGISSDALPHVFERFYQVDTARSREGGGAGLGLSLARWIADRHRATIEIASEPGKGTIAIVRLPLATTDVRSPDDVQVVAKWLSTSLSQRACSVALRPWSVSLSYGMGIGLVANVAFGHLGQVAVR